MNDNSELILERDLVGIHAPSQRLLLLSSTSDYEETLSLSGHMLRNKEQICIHTRLCDAHIYVIKKWVIDFLIQVIRGQRYNSQIFQIKKKHFVD